ncbi:MAG: hypothetical protein AB7E24_08735, partial [Novosphingobium sp.]
MAWPADHMAALPATTGTHKGTCPRNNTTTHLQHSESNIQFWNLSAATTDGDDPSTCFSTNKLKLRFSQPYIEVLNLHCTAPIIHAASQQQEEMPRGNLPASKLGDIAMFKTIMAAGAAALV